MQTLLLQIPQQSELVAQGQPLGRAFANGALEQAQIAGVPAQQGALVFGAGAVMQTLLLLSQIPQQSELVWQGQLLGRAFNPSG